MAPSRRPLVDHDGTTWLGDPMAPVFRIEVADDALVLTQPSSVVRVPWTDIASLDVRIPTASWSTARASYRVLSFLDAMQGTSSEGAISGTHMRYGNRDIELVIGLRDGSEVTGWAQKHQPLGYPEPEVRAATAVLQGRIRP